MKRIEALLPHLDANEVDGLLVTNVHNVSYLSGFTGDSSHLIVSRKGCILFTDPRYTEQASQECPSDIQVKLWVDNKRTDCRSYKYAVEALGIKTLGFESNPLSHNAYSALSEGLDGVFLKATVNLVETLRSIKDETEIACLKTAAEISDLALERTLPFIKAGVSEMQLVAQLEYQLKTNGAEGLSFDTMVLSGKKTSLLHGHPGSKVLENGDFILFDFGAVYKGYHADISRTFILGKANDTQRAIYAQIQNAEHAGVQAIKPGVSGKVPDAAVRACISELYLPYYYPGLGHGTGLEVHEGVRLSHESEDTLAVGQVLTVEPGIYIPDWGGMRIEDSVVVTANGVVSLNQFPRDLMCL